MVWELTRNNSSYLKKRNGSTKRSGSIAFSTEKGNVTSLNKHKYSGLANAKVASIDCAPDNKAVLIVKTASKPNQPKKSSVTIPMNKDFKRVESAIRKHTIDNYYRRDLESAMLGKWTKVYQGNRRAKGIKKTVPCKKGRGTL